MKTIYLDCSMGASASRFASALYELIENKDIFIRKVNSIGIKGVRVAARTESVCGFDGTRLSIRVMESDEGAKDNSYDDNKPAKLHKHRHRTLRDIDEIISKLDVSPKVRDDVIAIYTLIANAKSKASGKPTSEIRFRDEGSRDTITSILISSLLFENIAAQKIVASPINICRGEQGEDDKSAQPISAPSMVNLLLGMPIYSEKNSNALCTLAGAALIKYYVQEFGNMPVIKTEKIGYGITKNNNASYYMRALLGETPDISADLSELRCNVDDMTAEQIAYATQCFFAAGAIEVFTMPIVMRQSKPGNLICVTCDSDEKERFIALMFKHTTATDIKETLNRHYTLNCREETENTSLGPIKKKTAEGYGVMKTKYIFDDLKEIAEKYNMSVTEVLRQISK